MADSQPSPPPSLHGGEGSSFPGLVPTNDTVASESVMCIKPGHSGVVIGYQVDEFTHTWSAKQFVAHSHIYPGLTWIPILPILLGHQNWTLPWMSLMLLPSLDEPDDITSSVSSGFLHLVSTLSDNSKLQLAPSIRSHKLWCQARALLTPVPLATKTSASKLINYFFICPAAFGFWSLTPPDNIPLTSANRKADQSLSDLQTGVGAATHATVDTEQLIAHLRISLLDTLSSLPDSESRHYTCV